MSDQRGATSLANRSMKPERVLALGFLVLILLGGLLLGLPVSAADGRSIGALKGLFTATSAVCVTGLTLIDAGTQLSMFGQVVLICLIQIGGLGFMVFATLAMVALGRRISLRNRMLIRESMNQTSLSGMVRLTLWYTLMAFTIELAGAGLLMTRMIPRFGAGRGVWYSVFHAISAFCNAGFDLFGSSRSVMDYNGDPVVLLTLCGLIVLGGLGFSVMMECLHNRFRFHKLSLHAKIVLITTAVLLVAGFALTLLLEWSNPGTLGTMPPWQKALNGFFQSVTLRTAGFASVDQAQLSDTTKIICVLLMMVGASPASTGGGVKTTTFFLVLLLGFTVIRGRENITVFKREIGMQTVRRAITIIMIGFFVVIACTCIISAIEPTGSYSGIDILYEATSAFSTTGLTALNTASLTQWSQLLLMPLMYFGRVGPLTLAFALANRMESSSAANRVHYPEEKIMIG